MKHSRAVHQISFIFMAFLLALGIVAGPGLVSAVTAQESSSTPVADEELSRVDLVKQVTPAVVSVLNLTTTAPNPLTGQTRTIEPAPQGEGTGFIIDDEGHIVTNWHVVTGGDAFQVILYDGTKVDAELVGTDPRDDLAVVKIDPSDVPATVSFGDSSQLQVGQDVVAMGSPLGTFTNSVTAGIVSGLGRGGAVFNSGNPACQNYSNLIQHDAAINPGNSGGPLFNMRGEVIGVNTLGIPEVNGQPVQGLFFAIPSNTVKKMVQQMIETGTVKQAYMGVSFLPINPRLATQYQLPVDHGMGITEVQQGSPASDAGLKPGDIITAINGEEITPMNPVGAIVIDLEPGQTVTLSITNADSGKEREAELTLGETTLDASQCTLQDGR